MIYYNSNEKQLGGIIMGVELKELKGNALTVVGTLSEVSLELGTDRDNNEIIKGSIRVQVKQDDKVNVITLNVYNRKFTKKGTENKLYAGMKTVMEEYVSLQDTNGDEEKADRVSVNGDLSYNVYSPDGQAVNESNRFRATTLHRVNDKKDLEDGAFGQIPAVIESYEEELDSEDNPTGLYKVKALTVGYNGRVGRIMDLRVKDDLIGDMQGFFPEGSTGMLYFNILNYVIVEKRNVDSDGGGSFGQIHEVVQTNSYVRQLMVTGGKPLDNSDLNLSEEQIQKAHEELRKQRTEAISRSNSQTSVPVQSNSRSGFGNSQKSESYDPFANDGKSIDISDDDLPF